MTLTCVPDVLMAIVGDIERCGHYQGVPHGPSTWCCVLSNPTSVVLRYDDYPLWQRTIDAVLRDVAPDCDDGEWSTGMVVEWNDKTPTVDVLARLRSLAQTTAH